MGFLAAGPLQPPRAVPPAGEEDPAKADPKKLEGVWSVVSAESSGLKATAENAQATRIAIAVRRGGLIMAPCPANVDPKAALEELRKSNDLSRTTAFRET